MALNTHLSASPFVPRILFGVSPIGLGHATRALVLADELRRRGAEVRLFSGGEAADFIARTGVPVDNVVDDPGLSVAGGEMKGATVWYVRSWLAQRRNLERLRRLIADFSPDIVVGDEEFSGVTVAAERGIKRVFISDELELGFARSWLARKVEGRVEKWYKGLQRSVDLLVVPEFGSDSGNARFVGPIVRRATLTREAARKKFGLPQGEMVLFSMSGSGIGREIGTMLIAALGEFGADAPYLVVTGNRGAKFGGEGIYDLGLVLDNQNLVASADLVVSTAGKSTIDEAAAAGTPVIVIPIRHHAEQERNAAALGCTPEDLERLPSLLREKIGRRNEPKEFRGEVGAAGAILSLL